MLIDSEYEITSPENMSLLFRLGMWWRIFYGVLRIIVGVMFLKVIGQSISDFIYNLMAHELTGKASDIVLEKIYILFQTHEFTVTYFIAAYFIFWGIIEIFLSICLLKKMTKTFPIAMIFIAVFIIYAVFRYTHTHSIVLLGIIIIDIIILYLTHHEYRRLTQGHLR